ncbi:MAG: YfhO family protein [Chitinophagales bacterium]|nr:YfhO family protein [Chitinophagales bacterium]
MIKKYFAFAVLVAVPLIAFSQLWIHAYAMAFDMADYFLPNRFFLSQCLQSKNFPWWNPYSGLGIPFYADPQSGAFYPIAWVIGYFFGYDFYTINCEYLLHVIIAGAGMFTLMRFLNCTTPIALAIAISFQLCGVFIGNAQHLTWIISAAWMPWVFFYRIKFFGEGKLRDAIAAAFCLMMMTTGGYPGFLIVMLYIFFIATIVQSVVLIKHKKTDQLKNFVLINMVFAIIYFLITAPYIISFLQALPYFTRANALQLSPGYFLAFTPQSIVSFLFPSVTLSNISFFKSDASMINGYIGLLPLILLVTIFISKPNRKVWLLFSVSLLMLLISFGTGFIVWDFLFNYFPLINRIRFPSLFRVFAMFGFLVSAGLMMSIVASPKKIFCAIVILLGVIFFAEVFSFVDEHRIVFPTALNFEGIKDFFRGSSITNNILVQSIFQVFILLLFIFCWIMKNKWNENVIKSLLVLIVILDMSVAAKLNLPITIAGNVSTDSLNVKLKLQPNGFPLSLESKLTDFVHEGDGYFAPSFFNNNIFKKQFAYTSYNPFDLTSRDKLDLFSKQQLLLKHPIAFISNQPVSYPLNISDTTIIIGRNTFLIDDSERNKFSSTVNDSLQSEVEIISLSPNHFAFQTKSNQTAALVILQNYYPGWKAVIDGKSSVIINCNYSTMCLLLPAGNHKADFNYDPGIVKWWLYLSAVLQLVLLIYIAATAKRNES